MMWLKTLIGVRWLPYAALGVAAALGGAFGWGYLKGSHSAEERMGRAMQEALEAQAARFATIAKLDMEAALTAVMRENQILGEINAIPIPGTDDCSDPEWLHSYNAAVRAANSAGSTDTP